MNPAIADMKDRWAQLGPADKPAATLADFDETGTYRLRVMTVERVDAFAEYVWERWDRQEASPVD